ncbi:MAG: patatin-like phospholipase family protein [Kiloniellales bacterium]|nr:patatin-like phospholipase family protein [Kiloniellales bacterium]
MNDGNAAPTAQAGLALSGGGFRATLFHLGALWRMNELGQLAKIERLTGVSGGAITAGYLGYRWKDLDFSNQVAGNFAEVVAKPIQEFCARTVDTWAIFKGKFDPFHTAADYVAKAYDKHLFDGASLHALPDDAAGQGPRVIIYATNMQSGVSFRFSRPYMADYRIGQNYNTGPVRLADAVAASSAFPPILTPKVLKTKPEDWKQDDDPTKRGDLWPNVDFRRKIYLTDGGVYDNMGLEAISRDYDPVFVSAAGAPFSKDPMSWLTLHTEVGVALRATGIMTEQIRALRRRRLMDGYIKEGIKGAYWNIASEVAAYELSDPIVQDNSVTRAQQTVRTRLDSFSPQEQGHLINWGYAIADTAIRRWAAPQPPGDWHWPCPDYHL